MNTTDSPGPYEDERIRRAFALIAEEAGKPSAMPQTQPTGQSPHRRPRLLLAAVAAAVVCVGVGIGIAFPGDGGERKEGGAQRAADGQGQTLPEAIACAPVIARGDIASVSEPTADHMITFTLDVQEWIKPSAGKNTVRLTVIDPAYADPKDTLKAGQHVLVMTPQLTSRAAGIFRDKRADYFEKLIRDAMGKAAHTTCPPEWRAR
ncbi:hypothetical protein ACWD4J_10700 [Streptomyces sp. NPDC002577]